MTQEANEMSAPMLGSLALSLVLFAAGCDGTDRKAKEIDFNYKVIQIEGQEWIAYRGAHGIWQIAGPIGRPRENSRQAEGGDVDSTY